MERLIAIGDIHGCVHTLKTLLSEVSYDSSPIISYSLEITLIVAILVMKSFLRFVNYSSK